MLNSTQVFVFVNLMNVKPEEGYYNMNSFQLTYVHDINKCILWYLRWLPKLFWYCIKKTKTTIKDVLNQSNFLNKIKKQFPFSSGHIFVKDEYLFFRT